MINLTATLLAEQKKTNAVPYVELKAREKIGNATRYRWTRLYTGAEAITRHAATMPADGSLLRARLKQSGPNWELAYSRVASPGAGSNYSSWTVLISGISDTAGLALASFASRAILVYVNAAGTAISCITSSDNGATFGAEIAIDTAPAAVTHLAVAYRDANTLRLFYATNAGIVYTVEWTLAGGWSARGGWTNAANTITGLAAHYHQDYNLLVAGTNAAGDAKLWQCIYGDGYSVVAGDWGPLKEIMSASAGSNVTHSYTTLARTDVYRAFYVEDYAGTGAYTTPMASHALPSADYDDNLWREPWPLNIACATGVALIAGATYTWLTTPNGVWRATLNPADLDLTADVQSVRLILEEHGGHLTAEVLNDAGQYLESQNGKGDAWVGCELRLGLGYHTSAGDEATTHLSYWVTAYELTADPAKARLILHAVDPWKLLERWKARRQITWAAGSTTIHDIVQYLLARVGFAMSMVNASGQLSTVMPGFTLYPAFTVKPGESAATALRRILTLVTDGPRFQNATAIFTDRAAGDASAYAFGGAHAIKKAHYQTERQTNRVQVYAAGALGQAHDWTQIELTTDDLEQVQERNLNTAAKANTQAANILREATMRTRDDRLTIPPHCGLEIHDVVDVTDSRASLSAAKRRVKTIELTYDAKNAIYEQQIALGEV